jgi:hypothetical protein
VRQRVVRWRDPDKPKRGHPERDLQKAIIQYLRAVIAPPAVFTSIAHGGFALALAQGKALKATGLLAGWPDIQVVSDGRLYLAEVKTPSGRLSEAQERTHALLRAARCPVAVVRSVDDVQALLRGAWWAIPTREHRPDHVMDGLRAALLARPDPQSP